MTVTLIGGEMLQWSDLPPATTGAGSAAPSVLQPLLAAVTGRVLVAGPHDPALIDAIEAGELTVLVRGRADAAMLADRYASRPGTRVLCGSLGKLAAVPAYDTVIALAGLDGLLSAEEPGRPVQEILAMLSAVLRPGGLLVLAVENSFGLHRLVEVPPERTGADWVVTDGLGRTAVSEHLAAAGLQERRMYATYPGPPASPVQRGPSDSPVEQGSPAPAVLRGSPAPAVLLGPEILADRSRTGFLAATLHAAYAHAGPGIALTDPARLAAAAAQHDLAAALAPAWIILADRADPNGPPDPAVPPALPGLRHSDHLLPSAVIAVGADLRVIRSVRDLPAGDPLSDRLLTAVRRRDLPAVRNLLTTWLDGPAAGVPAEQVLLDAESRPTALAPAGPPLVALRHFAGRLIREGEADLWPGPADAAELTALLAAMTGRTVPPSEVPPGIPDPARLGVRELAMDRDRLIHELAEARAQLAWTERVVITREAELRRARQLNAVLSATIPGRAAKALLGRMRAVRAAIRRRGASSS